jgi:predicted PhzF superfamily epimerase YddE/YHI9
MPYYQVNAFTAGSVFSGNPAGVCLLDEWPEDSVMQSIAAENRLSETAFLVLEDGHYGLRWFTPKVEIDLCGHATLASGHVIFEYVSPGLNHVEFASQSGRLTVSKKGNLLVMDFPSWVPRECPPPEGIREMLGHEPVATLCTRDLLCVFESQSQILELRVDMDAVSGLEWLGVAATAPGDGCDFVSRFFGPKVGIPEDPVTGSAHSSLVPYWSRRLGKSELHASQLSSRGGELFCEQRGDRVNIGGRAVTYLMGNINI